jgi:hypothetical protein
MLVPPAAVASILGASLGACDPPDLPSPAPSSAPARVSSPPRVLMIGDSIMDEHGNHARVALKELGIKARVAGHWGSGLFTRAHYDCGELEPDPENQNFSWLKAARVWIADFDPDLVLVYLNHNYGPDVPRSAEQCRSARSSSIAIDSPEFTSMSQTLLRELMSILRSRGARVDLVKPLPMVPNQAASANPIWRSYLTLQQELRFGIVDAGDAVADPQTGGRIEVDRDCFGAEKRIRPAGDAHLTYFGAGRMGTRLARGAAKALGIDLGTVISPTDDPSAIIPAPAGFRIVTCDSASFGFGEGVLNVQGAAVTGESVVGPAAGVAVTASKRGYVIVHASGRVLPFGDASDFGSVTPALSAPDVARGIALTPSGRGYWIVTASGGVRTFGDAPLLGRAANPGAAAVGITAMPGSLGYWLATATGRVLAFGTAPHFGDLANEPLARPIVALTTNAAGTGYWLLDDAGNVFAFGSAVHLGDASNRSLYSVQDWKAEPVPAWAKAVGMSATPAGDGYWVLLSSGAVCGFGSATRLGSLYRTHIDPVLGLTGEPLYPGDSPCE